MKQKSENSDNKSLFCLRLIRNLTMSSKPDWNFQQLHSEDLFKFATVAFPKYIYNTITCSRGFPQMPHVNNIITRIYSFSLSILLIPSFTHHLYLLYNLSASERRILEINFIFCALKMCFRDRSLIFCAFKIYSQNLPQNPIKYQKNQTFLINQTEWPPYH